MGTKLLPLLAVILCLFAFTGLSRTAFAEDDLFFKKLESNPAVKGAITSRTKAGERCEKISPKKTNSHYDEKYQALVFKTSISCWLEATDDDGGGIVTTILITGQFLDGEILIREIDFSYAG